jgi:hypothetical protein
MGIGTGPLRVGADLAVQRYGSIGTNRSIGTISAASAESPPYALYSQFNNWAYIDIAWGGITDIPASGQTEEYRTVNIINQTPTQIISINLAWNQYAYANTASPAYMYESITYRLDGGAWLNAGSSNTTTVTFLGGGTETATNSSNYTITGIDYNDTLQVKTLFDWSGITGGSSYQDVVISAPTVTTGKGIANIDSGLWISTV